MPRSYYFLSTRAQSVGGPVGPVKVLRNDLIGSPTNLAPQLAEAVHGRDVLFVVHGFNVNQTDGLGHLGYWMDNLDIGNAVSIGILWPGDCFIPIFVDYIVDGNEAINSGNLLADFISQQLPGATSVSFTSHSLGARVALQTISRLALSVSVRRCVLMAGAIDNTCLTDEYKNAANRVGEISILASHRDDVLELAYPAGNLLQGIIDRGHPYWHAALGREGAACPYPPPPKLQPSWMIPDSFNYGHLDYIPGAQLAGKFPMGVDIPPDDTLVPPSDSPATLQAPGAKWKPAWSSSFVSTRFQRP